MRRGDPATDKERKIIQASNMKSNFVTISDFDTLNLGNVYGKMLNLSRINSIYPKVRGNVVYPITGITWQEKEYQQGSGRHHLHELSHHLYLCKSMETSIWSGQAEGLAKIFEHKS